MVNGFGGDRRSGFALYWPCEHEEVLRYFEFPPAVYNNMRAVATTPYTAYFRASNVITHEKYLAQTWHMGRTQLASLAKPPATIIITVVLKHHHNNVIIGNSGRSREMAFSKTRQGQDWEIIIHTCSLT